VKRALLLRFRKRARFLPQSFSLKTQKTPFTKQRQLCGSSGRRALDTSSFRRAMTCRHFYQNSIRSPLAGRLGFNGLGFCSAPSLICSNTCTAVLISPVTARNLNSMAHRVTPEPWVEPCKQRQHLLMLLPKQAIADRARLFHHQPSAPAERRTAASQRFRQGLARDLNGLPQRYPPVLSGYFRIQSPECESSGLPMKLN